MSHQVVAISGHPGTIRLAMQKEMMRMRMARMSLLPIIMMQLLMMVAIVRSIVAKTQNAAQLDNSDHSKN